MRACCSPPRSSRWCGRTRRWSETLRVALAHRGRRSGSATTCCAWTSSTGSTTALMALFFFVIGLEVRRELLDRRADRPPPRGRAGDRGAGGIARARRCCSCAVNPSGDAARGWGVVIGTDTAFLLGALAHRRPALPDPAARVPADAVGRRRHRRGRASSASSTPSRSTSPRSPSPSSRCSALGAAQPARRVARRRSTWCSGVVLWIATLESGLHPTIAGMVAGLAIAAARSRRARTSSAAARCSAPSASRRCPSVGLHGRSGPAARGLGERAAADRRCTRGRASSIVPLFALANAGRRPARRRARATRSARR